MRQRVGIAVVAALLLLPGIQLTASITAAAADQCFPETGKCMQGRFAQYWEEHGGLAQQGYPITDEFDEISSIDGKAYRVQYFERARFEYHPENQPPYDVLLGQLGREQYLAKYPTGRPAGGTGDVCFEVTNRCLRGIFFQYWNEHGGLDQQGYPLSDEFDEVSPTDGKTYRVQYFERARFEYHPENQPPYNVLLGLLGREQYTTKYGSGVPLSGGVVTELVGTSVTVPGILNQPLTVQVTDARQLAAIPAGNGDNGATAPAGQTFIAVFYTLTNNGKEADLLADYTCLRDSSGRCVPPNDDATASATALYDRFGPYDPIDAGATHLGIIVYVEPASASGFSLAARAR